MREVVIDGDAIGGAFHFHAPLDIFERAQRLNGYVRRHPRMACGSDSRERIGNIVFTGQIPAHTALHRPVEQHVEAVAKARGSVPFVSMARAGLPATGNTIALDGCPTTALEHAVKIRITAVADNQTVARHGAQQMMKLRFYGREVVENIRMIVFEVIQNRRARMVMHELGTFVEERGVVFVGFDDEERRWGKPCRHTKILRHAADQKSGIKPAVFEHPRQHRSGGGLTMRARDGQHPLVTQHVIGQPLRPGSIRQAAIEYLFHQRIAARDHVAGDE